MKIKKEKCKVSAVYWQDAAYSFEESLPNELPPIEITTGIIISKNKRFINITTNFDWHTKNKLRPHDGFLIPQKTILKIKKVGYL